MGFKDKHLLGIEPMRPEAIVEILDLAEKYVQLNRSKDKRAGSLTGLTQINMFFENSLTNYKYYSSTVIRFPWELTAN